jgi:hypothetical protein
VAVLKLPRSDDVCHITSLMLFLLERLSCHTAAVHNGQPSAVLAIRSEGLTSSKLPASSRSLRSQHLCRSLTKRAYI